MSIAGCGVQEGRIEPKLEKAIRNGLESRKATIQRIIAGADLAIARQHLPLVVRLKEDRSLLKSQLSEAIKALARACQKTDIRKRRRPEHVDVRTQLAADTHAALAFPCLSLSVEWGHLSCVGSTGICKWFGCKRAAALLTVFRPGVTECD